MNIWQTCRRSSIIALWDCKYLTNHHYTTNFYFVGPAVDLNVCDTGALVMRVICGDLKKAVLAGAQINALAILGILPYVYDQTITLHLPWHIHSGPGQ